MNDVFLDLLQPHKINITGWFQFHEIQSAEEYQFYLNGNFPVYQKKVNPNLKNSTKYPIEFILEQFYYFRNEHKKNCLTSTAAFMLALAIQKRYKNIYLYGIDCKHENYKFQKEALAYLTGYAAASEINVIIPDESDLMRPDFIYSYEEAATVEFTKRKLHPFLKTIA